MGDNSLFTDQLADSAQIKKEKKNDKDRNQE